MKIRFIRWITIVPLMAVCGCSLTNFGCHPSVSPEYRTYSISEVGLVCNGRFAVKNYDYNKFETIGDSK